MVISCCFSFQPNEDVPQSGTVSFSAAEAQPLSSYSPITVGEPIVGQNQELQAAVVESVKQPAEKNQAIQVTETYKPLSQCITSEQKPVPGKETKSIYCTGKGSRLSNIAGTAASQRMTSSSKHKPRDAKQDQRT